MTKLQQIREIIIKSNPEIVELKFGCEMYSKEYPETIKTYLGKGVSDGEYFLQNEIGTICLDEVALFEIIGRPIRLADVLLAIGEDYLCDGKGQFWHSDPQTGETWDIKGEQVFWNLKKDSSDKQSEECIDFLHKILI